ncbi:MAG TPA: flagellar FlbD family protein [Bacilli bacterium]
MIALTRLNGTQVTVNALLIETIEATPDTIITLTTGKKLVVREQVTEVVELVKVYMRNIGSVRLAIKTENSEGS